MREMAEAHTPRAQCVHFFYFRQFSRQEALLLGVGGGLSATFIKTGTRLGEFGQGAPGIIRSLLACFFPSVWLRATSHQHQDTTAIHSFSFTALARDAHSFWFFTRSTTAVRLVFYTSSPRCSLQMSTCAYCEWRKETRKKERRKNGSNVVRRGGKKVQDEGPRATT